MFLPVSDMSYSTSQYKGNIQADISGSCCSAASIVACATGHVRAFPTAMYMIHNVSSGARGNYHDMDKQSQILQTGQTEPYQLFISRKQAGAKKNCLT